MPGGTATPWTAPAPATSPASTSSTPPDELGTRVTQTMPGWLQAFAANQPVTVTTNALRGLILGQGALPPGQTVTGQVVLALVWSAAITAVFAPLAVRLYRRAVS